MNTSRSQAVRKARLFLVLDVARGARSPRARALVLPVLLLAAAGFAGVACRASTADHIEVHAGECVTCHRPEYLMASNPPHEDVFPLQCASCHSYEAWSPAIAFEHEDFPLTGAHGEAMCTSCHTEGYAEGQTPTECVGCHRDDYERSPFPGHDAFATTCQECHGTMAWKPATLPDHPFPLEGAHAMATCASCHTTGYAPGDTPSTCVSCHRDDYDGSPYPGHDLFPTTCNDCHTTSAWTPATGGHPESRFPTRSGPHEVVECLECHDSNLGANNRDNADCVGCHTGHHTRSTMDEKHHEVGDYPSGAAPPNFCLDCHPAGRKDD